MGSVLRDGEVPAKGKLYLSKAEDSLECVFNDSGQWVKTSLGIGVQGDLTQATLDSKKAEVLQRMSYDFLELKLRELILRSFSKFEDGVFDNERFQSFFNSLAAILSQQEYSSKVDSRGIGRRIALLRIAVEVNGAWFSEHFSTIHLQSRALRLSFYRYRHGDQIFNKFLARIAGNARDKRLLAIRQLLIHFRPVDGFEYTGLFSDLSQKDIAQYNAWRGCVELWSERGLLSVLERRPSKFAALFQDILQSANPQILPYYLQFFDLYFELLLKCNGFQAVAADLPQKSSANTQEQGFFSARGASQQTSVEQEVCDPHDQERLLDLPCYPVAP